MQPYCCKQKSKAFPHLVAGEALQKGMLERHGLLVQRQLITLSYLLDVFEHCWGARLRMLKLFYAVLEHIPDPGEVRADSVLIGGMDFDIVSNLNMEVVTIEVILLATIEEHELVLDKEPSLVKLNLGMEQVKLLLPATIEDRFADKLVCLGSEIADLLGGEGSHDELSFY